MSRWRGETADLVPRHAQPKSDSRRKLGWGATGFAALVVYAVLISPHKGVDLSTPLSWFRIPIEGLVGAGILLVLPARARRIGAVVGGAILGLMLLLWILRTSFVGALGRPFDPVFDWPQVGNGIGVLAGTAGSTQAYALVAGAVVASVVLIVLVTRAVRRLVHAGSEHRLAAGRALAVLSLVWLLCLAFSVQLTPGVPVASRSIVELAVQTGQQVWSDVEDRRRFDEQLAAEATIDTTPNLLSALRGKDVVFTFVESYGREALRDPEFALGIVDVLERGTEQLKKAGFSARSAFLTSSVSGGQSWLAHATLQSGLRVTNQDSFDSLIGSDRQTLTSAFKNAGWDTVAVLPANTGPWPAETFYGFDRTYDAHRLGNKSRTYHIWQTPDQYTLSAFQKNELGREDRGPLMAEITLVTSHWPWAEVPFLRDWDDVGDGSVFDQPGAGRSENDQQVMVDTARMRDGYRRSIEYSLSALISYVETYGDDDLVLVFLGDHQPPAYIIRENAGFDVPVTIVTRDQAVLDRIDGWKWQAGLWPRPRAPVWPMESFRDRFLEAFEK